MAVNNYFEDIKYMASVKFTATKLTNTGKKGIIKPDADGYYELVIGGLNTFNSAGEYYTFNGAEELFKQSSIFMRRVTNGCLKGEVGHPKRSPGMSMDDYVNRILTIDEGNVCAHFKEVWLDTEFGKKNSKFNNNALVAIMAKVKPTGPKADSLANSLNNSSENVCFSIRALTKDYYEKGQTFRVLQQIICFDAVTEPGINIANKWDTPSLESLENCIISKNSIEKIVYSKNNTVAIESNRELAIECLKAFNSKIVKIETPLYNRW
jgi:hypothetical protein